jgi:thioester reductase-like protein/amino acid adenylation domain-containing protein
MRFQCYIIGDDSLVKECGQILLRHGHKILGALTSDARVKEWALTNHINIFSNLRQLENYIKESNELVPDYIFSISNTRILKASTLSLTRKFCINYHNAMLPSYKGTNPTSWAILEGKSTHGVTWHVMTEKVDDGDILAQQQLPIEPNDTAASLNAKCHWTAIQVFPNLIESLANDNCTKTSQIKEKSTAEKSYYPLSERPSHYGFILWDRDAEEIDRLYRGLTTSPHINRLTTPKIIYKDIPYIPLQLKQSPQGSEIEAGIIVLLNDHEMHVATKTKNIIITQIASLSGKAYSIAEFIQLSKIRQGDSLASAPDNAEMLAIKSGKNWCNESYWVSEFKKVQPYTLPFLEFDEKYQHSQYESAYLFTSKLQKNIMQGFESFTLQRVVLVAFIGYLYRINRYSEYTVGISDQGLKEKLQGNFDSYFSCVVPLNICLEEQKSFKDLLLEESEELDELSKRFTYEKDIFFRRLDIPKEAGALPLVFNIENGRQSAEKLLSKLSVGVVVTLTRDGMIFNGRGIKDANIFNIATRKIFQHVSTLLSYASKNINQSLYKIPFLTKEEQEALIQVCNLQSTTLPNSTHAKEQSLLAWLQKTIQRKFETNTEFDLGLVSSVLDNGSISFKEIDVKSSRIASYLLSYFKNTVQYQQAVVAVCLDTPLLQVITMLGIMKAGATYLPLDPKLPSEQLLHVLKQTNSTVLFTRSTLAARFIGHIDKVKIISLDYELPTIYQKGELRELNLSRLSLNNAAYIITTSGSTTGRPKCIPVQHSNILASLTSRIDYYQSYYEPDKKMKMLMLLSTSFDTSIAAIFWPLLLGGELFMLTPHQLRDIKLIIKAISRNKISHIICVPALYEKILKLASSDDLASLKLVIVGGDYLAETLIDKHIALAKGAFLFNEFGLTEVTIASTVKLVYDPKTKNRFPSTIGFPFGDNKVFITDKYDNLLPYGVVGKLLIGGSQLTSGYIGQGNLTREKFRVIKFLGEEVPVFDTGDNVILTPDHGMIYRGREDFQVKIRGVLVMPSQVEKWLLEYPNVKECVVVGRKSIQKETELVAYLVPKDNNKPIDYSCVKQYLSQYLSVVAVPTVFMSLVQLPLTLHHKVDRKALPFPKTKQRYLSSMCIPAQTSIEKRLVSIWETLLDIESVSIDDNFFDLGGHSLLVTDLLSCIEKVFNLKIKVASFYRAPTIHALANHIGNKCQHEQKTPTLFIQDLNMQLGITIKESRQKKLLQLHNVFLTGATGFLGVYLLKELLARTQAKIYCLIRAINVSSAWEKLKNTIVRCRLDDLLSSENMQRIVIILGDLQAPRFGLTEYTYADLANKIDSIYHSAAEVHHFLPYAKLRATNVCGTKAMIQFAAEGKLKSINYVSTLSTKNKEAYPDLSSDIIEITKQNGYTQSKWMAELLLTKVAQQGMPVTIYRPSWILGDSKTGACFFNQNHFLLLLKGCVQLGYAPKWTTRLNIMPVNYVSQMIVATSQEKQAQGKVFNLCNPNEITWIDFIGLLRKQELIDVQLINPVLWRDEYLAKVGQKNALYPLAAFYLSHEGSDMVQELPSLSTSVQNENAKVMMEELGIRYPKITAELLTRYFQYLHTEGFISASLEMNGVRESTEDNWDKLLPIVKKTMLVENITSYQ